MLAGLELVDRRLELAAVVAAVARLNSTPWLAEAFPHLH